MRRRYVFACFLIPLLGGAAELGSLYLPAVQMDGGKPLMQALRARRSTREFAPGKISAQVLSNLLWAADGVNRGGGMRTAPSAMNREIIDVYVATEDGLFKYEPKNHRLREVLSEDIRALTGTQAFVQDAAVNLIYVADVAKMEEAAPEDQILYAAAEAGFIGQNVYLFCASEGLATVVRGGIDRTSLARKMVLRPEQKIVLAQSVGLMKKLQ